MSDFPIGQDWSIHGSVKLTVVVPASNWNEFLPRYPHDNLGNIQSPDLFTIESALIDGP
jgi:hypothetical protein